MHPVSSPRNSFEDRVSEENLEESLLPKNSPRFSQHNNFISWFNVLFALSNIVAAASIYLSKSNALPATKAEYGMQRVLTMP